MGHTNDRSTKASSLVNPTSLNLQPRPFAPLESDEKEEAVSRKSGYSENFLEKIINTPSSESATPVQRKSGNRLKAIAAERANAALQNQSIQRQEAVEEEKSEGEQKDGKEFTMNPEPPPVQRKFENRLRAKNAQKMTIQAKLAIGEPNDKYEQEADATAARVVQQINSPTTSQSQPVQRKFENRLRAKNAQKMAIQAKLAIGEPNDKYEQEADATAARVVQQINSSIPSQSQLIQRQEMEEDEELQMKPFIQRSENIGGGEASTDLESAIQSARGSGQSLDANLQQSMGQAMGADFSGVKVHTDSQSDQLNKSIQAKAFTTGQDLFFRQGAYEPSSRGGQELIAHELTHVVQQNGGAVQRSSIPKHVDFTPQEIRGISGRGEKYSETLMPLAIPSLGIVQRKVAYKNPEQWMISELKVTLKDKLLSKKEALFKEEDQKIIDTLFTEQYYGELFKALERLSYSENDYGTFDLGSNQHLVLLFHELKKHLVLPKESGIPAEEIEKSKEQTNEKKRVSGEYAKKSPNPDLTFDLALLGAGAATAYYLTSAGNSIDKMNTIVIGPTQPWGRDRGPGVINHPLHMITAIREEVGLGNEELSPREDFSKIVEQVIDKYVIHRRPYKVENVTKVDGESGEKFYEIKVDNGVKFYARKVVAGLGIGPHSVPINSETKQPQTALQGRRAINMDEFQQRAESISKTVKNPEEEDITVVVGGGNAGIDAVMTAIRYGFKIIWVTGSERPKLLPGTDNEIVEEEYEKVINAQGSKIQEVIKKYANGAKESEKEPPEKPIIVSTGDGDRSADYFVYALGPDIKKIKDIFDKNSILDQLVPTYDKNRQFSSEGLSAVVGLEVENQDKTDKTSLEIIGGSAFRMAGDISYDYMIRMWRNLSQIGSEMAGITGELDGSTTSREDRDRFNLVIEEMRKGREQTTEYSFVTLKVVIAVQRAEKLDEVPKLELVPDLSGIKNILNQMKLDEVQDKKLINIRNKYLGCIRFVQQYGKTLAEYTNTVRKYLEKKAEAEQKNTRLRDTDPRKAGSHTEDVINSLPLNVAVNDQLTPIRSQIEASAAFVPDYVLEDVNFATDSNTVISIYISVNFPDLSDRQVDEWVDRVIRWRRPSPQDIEKYKMLQGPLPNPHNKPRENARIFSDWFKKRLGEENEKAKK